MALVPEYAKKHYGVESTFFFSDLVVLPPSSHICYGEDVREPWELPTSPRSKDKPLKTSTAIQRTEGGEGTLRPIAGSLP